MKKNLTKNGIKTEAMKKLENYIIEYLYEQCQAKKKVGTQSELATYFTDKSVDILGEHFVVTRDRVSSCMNKHGYTRSKKTGKLNHSPIYKRKDELSNLTQELKWYSPGTTISLNPEIYVLKSDNYRSTNLRAYIEEAFPNEILGIYTSIDSLLIVVNPLYIPEEKELTFKKYLDSIDYKIDDLQKK